MNYQATKQVQSTAIQGKTNILVDKKESKTKSTNKSTYTNALVFHLMQPLKRKNHRKRNVFDGFLLFTS